jgi:hypothetical protein
MTKYVVENTYFTLGDKLYKQIHGIPMGTDCAPQLANLFLHSLEHKYMMNNIYKKHKIVHSLSNTYRYIDDLTVINGSDTMDRVKSDIYPDYLDLVKVNSNNTSADVLDITIELKGHKFITKLFDKRKSLPFDTVCFPHIDSNMPQQIFFNTFSSQILRYSLINDNLSDFKDCVADLANMIRNRGYTNHLMSIFFDKTIKKHKTIITKYNLRSLSLNNILPSH